MTLSDERALELVSRQGFGKPKEYGPKAPTTIKELLGFLHVARVRGYAIIDEVFAPGMSAIAAPVFQRKEAIGVISIAGPRARLGNARMHELAPALLAAAAELGPISNASTLFGKPPLGKGRGDGRRGARCTCARLHHGAVPTCVTLIDYLLSLAYARKKPLRAPDRVRRANVIARSTRTLLSLLVAADASTKRSSPNLVNSTDSKASLEVKSERPEGRGPAYTQMLLRSHT